MCLYIVYIYIYILCIYIYIAPAHTSKMAMESLKGRFPEKLITLKSEFSSPDLNPLYFYIWGYMKEEIRRYIYTVYIYV